MSIFSSCNTDNKNNSRSLLEHKIDSLLAKMTLEEKIGQMTIVRHFDDVTLDEVATKQIGAIIHTQGETPGKSAKEWQAKFSKFQQMALSTRLGIPLLFGVDAVHGQNTFNGATIFPHNIGLGAANNAKLVEKAAKITAIEAQATGFNWVFSPCVAVAYNEKWGRVYESFSESTKVTNKLAVASVKGYQGNLIDGKTVMATAKHFLGDGATDYGVEGGNTTLTETEINKHLLPPYRVVVNQGVGAVMASFNKLSGKDMHANKTLITETLKNKMDFDGIVVSDWKGYTRFGENAIVKAGIDMVMAVDGDLDVFQYGVKKAVENGNVTKERIDDAVRRILRQKYRLGLFKYPYANADLISKIGINEHREVAKQAVRESMVLLKNRNNLLPIDKTTPKIVVVGEHANNAGLQSGGWTINWQGVDFNYKGATTILDGITKLAQGEVIYDENAIGSHHDADLAIIVVGETPYAEFFGDIGHESNNLKLTLSAEHENYIDYYKNLGVKTVVILISGRPLVVTENLTKVDAFVAAWLPGSEGNGVAEVLFGDFNFKGRLPHSWPKAVKDCSGKHGPNFWDESITPLFPFGFGLEYNNE